MGEQYPRFLKNSPEGKDLFEGKSHDKIAEMIHDIISNDSFENHIIGLEGEWGSGKSNVIEILKSKFINDERQFHFFTYDTWGHQEDLTRRSFLEELISELLNKNLLNNKSDKWKELEAQLLAKKSTKHTNRYPLIKKFWIIFTLSLLTFAGLDIIYDDFFKEYNLIKSYYFFAFKPFVIKFYSSNTFHLWNN